MLGIESYLSREDEVDGFLRSYMFFNRLFKLFVVGSAQLVLGGDDEGFFEHRGGRISLSVDPHAGNKVDKEDVSSREPS